jgi:energy-coupling factor transport system substrate-specific component
MTEEKTDSNKIAGCSFSIYPMCDQFADLILSALEATDTSKVWIKTDEVSTIARGRISHVFDVVQAVFLQTAKSGEHVVCSGMFSIGCPGDSEGHSFLAEDDFRMNKTLRENENLNVAAKFALYPMGGGDYMDLIYNQIEAMKKHGVEVSLTHYETKLFGLSRNIFEGLENVFRQTDFAGSSHTVMTITISANSPSLRNS